jgi:hypothetical protein
MASVWASTARWVKATGLGSTVVPELNCTIAKAFGSSFGAGAGAPDGSSSRVKAPKLGRAR